ncbi:hypothetical protein HZA87_00400 [Candidatus Uhrbacteria bacterium]|nr:hypothetical protein [Candidatus Uhrbacteria bacterium]
MTLILALFALLCACSQDPVPVAPPPEPKPASVPEYNLTLDETAEVNAWKAKTLALASALANPPDSKILDGWEAAFAVTDESVKAFLEDPHAQDWGSDSFRLDSHDRTAGTPPSVEPFVPNAARASELETLQEHYKAGLHYAALGDKEGVARCMKALERKLEWNAIAILAYQTNDNEKLYAAMDKMRELSWDERMKGIVGRAIEDHQMARAEEIATHYSGNLYGGDWDASLEKAGDPNVMAKLVKRRITHWIELASKSCRDENNAITCEGMAYNIEPDIDDDWRVSTPDLAGIVKLAQTDRATALQIARQFLESRYANVVSATDSCGEGCSSAMVPGTLEFYTLVSSESDLRAKYLGKTRAWATGAIGSMRDEQTGTQVYRWKNDYDFPMLPSFQFYAAVKALGDQDIIQAWSDNLALIARLEPYNRIGEENAVALDRYLLGLPGGSIKAVDAFTYGRISQQELTRIWGEMNLPTPPAGSTLTIEQIEQVTTTARDLTMKGYEDEALKVMHSLLPTETNLNNMMTLQQLGQLRVYLSLQQGRVEEAQRSIADEISHRRKEITRWNETSEADFKSALTLPYKVAAENLDLRVMETNGDRSPAVAKPMGMADAHAMLVPVMDEIAKLPTIHDRALIWTALEGDRSFLDLEVARRTEEGRLAEVQQLLAALPNSIPQPR